MKFLSLFLLLSVMVGCSTTDSLRSPSTGELQRQREAATDQAVYEEGMRKGYEAIVANPKGLTNLSTNFHTGAEKPKRQ